MSTTFRKQHDVTKLCDTLQTGCLRRSVLPTVFFHRRNCVDMCRSTSSAPYFTTTFERRSCSMPGCKVRQPSRTNSTAPMKTARPGLSPPIWMFSRIARGASKRSEEGTADVHFFWIGFCARAAVMRAEQLTSTVAGDCARRRLRHRIGARCAADVGRPRAEPADGSRSRGIRRAAVDGGAGPQGFKQM
jgi:hypothetical protein